MRLRYLQGLQQFVGRIAAAISLALVPASFCAAQPLPSGVINAPPTAIGDNESIGSDTTLNLREGGSLGDFFEAGLPDGSSSNVLVNISGGTVGERLRAYSGSVVNISSGNIVDGIRAGSGSILNVSGGTIGDETFRSGFSAGMGSLVNVTGGTVIGISSAAPESTVNISGGSVGPFRAYGVDLNISGGAGSSRLHIYSSSSVRITGGTVGPFVVLDQGLFELVGGQFRLNGMPFVEPSVTLARGDLVTGTYADGSPFAFSEGLLPFYETFSQQEMKLTSAPLPAIDTTPIVIDGSGAAPPVGLRDGQTLTLRDGGVLGNDFTALGATLSIAGGVVGSRLEASRTDVSITDGVVGDSFVVYPGSTASISGGTIGRGFSARPGSTVTITGTEFSLNGVLIDLEVGVPTVIVDRRADLTGFFADGRAFDFDLHPSEGVGDLSQDFFSNDATLILILIPEPSSGTALLSAAVLASALLDLKPHRLAGRGVGC